MTIKEIKTELSFLNSGECWVRIVMKKVGYGKVFKYVLTYLKMNPGKGTPRGEISVGECDFTPEQLNEVIRQRNELTTELRANNEVRLSRSGFRKKYAPTIYKPNVSVKQINAMADRIRARQRAESKITRFKWNDGQGIKDIYNKACGENNENGRFSREGFQIETDITLANISKPIS